jgi:hypothetical protein
MNPAPTIAKTNEQDGPFQTGASMAVDGKTTAQGNRPETIADRKQNRFQGSTKQPLRKGNKRKFYDAPENHPTIPKSKYSPVTQEIDAVPISGGGQVNVAGLNKNV